MIIKLVDCRIDRTVTDVLPQANMVIDPRPIGYKSQFLCKVTVEGLQMKIKVKSMKRNNQSRNHVLYPLRFRVYHSSERRYSFDSIKYIYNGVEDEQVPPETKEVIVMEGVGIIRKWAFRDCYALEKVYMPSTVTEISKHAFFDAVGLRTIQLPPNLQLIGEFAFLRCKALESIYIPPTVSSIGRYTFLHCESLRILNIPETAKDNIGRGLVHRCGNLLTEEANDASSLEQAHWLKKRYNTLHELCWNPLVTADEITHRIEANDQEEERARTNDKPAFTALHLLAANPSVTGEMITAYLQLAPDVAVVQDNFGKTPLHMLCSVSYLSDTCGDAIRAYLKYEEGARAAFVKDGEEMTPLGSLCWNNSHEDIHFLKDQSFAGLMIWWFHCLGINVFVN